MPDEIPQGLLKSLLTDTPVDQAIVIEAIRLARGVDVEDVKIANAIMPDAGTYLGRFAIEPFIRAEMTDQEVRREIARQKTFFDRLANLLPTLLRHFRFDGDQDVLSALHLISDVHQDFDARSVSFILRARCSFERSLSSMEREYMMNDDERASRIRAHR